MKIAIQNKLAHLQTEYNSLRTETQMLNSQVIPLCSQLGNLSAYLRQNAGDRMAVKQYGDVQRRYNSLQNQIRRNNTRLGKLELQIQQEVMRQQTKMVKGYK